MPRVNSAAIHQIEWQSGTLSIWFHSSGKYNYYGVPERTFEEFLDAPSKGAYFNNHIRDHY